EREESQQFDLLVMDAFSGDSVPVHLITEEAFTIYFRHLKPTGMLAVNISNHYLDLRQVIERAASRFGRITLAYPYYAKPDEVFCFSSEWALVAPPSIRESSPALVNAGTAIGPSSHFRMWTDDFSNLWSILR